MEPWMSMPVSTLVILAISITVSLISVILSRSYVKPDTIRLLRREMDEWKRYMEEFRKTGDAKYAAKLRKKQRYIMRVQARMLKQQLKFMVIVSIPFFALFLVLQTIFPPTLTIARSPVSIPFVGRELRFYHWYFLCAIAFGPILSKLLGFDISAM
jgi:uncharacterized membrane protein (DUF106 family)